MGRKTPQALVAALLASLCLAAIAAEPANADGMVKFGFQKAGKAAKVDGYSKLRFDTHLVEVRWWKVTFSKPVWAWGAVRKSLRAQGAPPPIGIYWKTAGETELDLLVVAKTNRHYTAHLTVTVAENPSSAATKTPTPTPKPTKSATPAPTPTGDNTQFGYPSWNDYKEPKFRVKQINCVQNGWTYVQKEARYVANWQINFLMQAYDGNFVRKSATSSTWRYVGTEDKYNWWAVGGSIRSLTPPADAPSRKLRSREVSLRVWSPNWKSGMPSDDTKTVTTQVLFHVKKGTCTWRDPIPPTS